MHNSTQLLKDAQAAGIKDVLSKSDGSLRDLLVSLAGCGKTHSRTDSLTSAAKEAAEKVEVARDFGWRSASALR